MKRLIFTAIVFVVALLSLVLCKAQSAEDQYLKVQYLGYDHGKYNFLLTEKQDCGSTYDYGITSTVSIQHLIPSDNNSGGHINATGSQEIHVEADYVNGAKFTFEARTKCIWSGESSIPITIGSLTSLPITLKSFTAIYLGDDVIQFKWSVDMEHDVQDYEVWEQLPDGYERNILSVSSLGDTDTRRDYGGTYIYSPIQASVGIGAMLIGLAIFIPTVVRKRRWLGFLIGGICLLLSFTSCHKTNLPVKKEPSTKFFKLKERDLNGVTKVHSTIQVKIN